MSEPKAYEVVPQVIVKENAPEGTPQAKTLQKEMEKNLSKREWIRAGELARDVSEVNYEGFARRTSSFGVELDNKGRVKRTAEGDDSEVKLAERIGKVEALTRKFFEVGYDQLEDAEKINIRESILNQARRIPLLEKRVQQAIDEGKGQQFAERLIKDPTFSGELKNFINGQLEGDFSNLVIEKWEELAEAKDEEELTRQELEVLEAQVNQDQSRLNSFKRNPDGTAEENATSAKRLDELRSNPVDPNDNPEGRRTKIATLDQELIVTQQLVKDLESDQSTSIEFSMKAQTIDPELLREQNKLIALKNDFDAQEKIINDPLIQNKTQAINKKAALEGQITTQQAIVDQKKALQAAMPGMEGFQQISEQLKEARTKVTEIQGQLATLKGKDAELQALEQEEIDARERVKNLEAEKRNVLERHQGKTRERQKAEREYNAAKEVRLSEEKNLTVRLENAWGAAANAIVSRKIEEGTAAYGEELEGLRKQSASAHEDAAMVTLMNTWLGPERTRKMGGLPGFRKKETVRPMDKNKILADYKTLLTEGDHALVRSIFLRTENPDTGTNFTNDEIDDIYDKNPSLIDKVKPEAVKQLLARKAMVGGFTPEDTYTLTSTEWGKNAVQQAFDQNAEFRQKIRDVFGEGALQRHGFWQRFGQEMAKHPFWWTLLLGIPALFGTIGTEPERDSLDRQR